MKFFSESLSAKLRSRVTTLCWCWRVTRNDGAVLGFTDHDRTLVFDGTDFEASTGFTGSEMTASLGLNVDNLEVDGALSSERLSHEDLADGLYDDARVEIFLVDWADVDDRALMRVGSLGEVTRGGGAFSAEVRGLSHYLQQPRGRLFQHTCDADLGDERCQVDLNDPAFRAVATITELVSDRSIAVSGLGAFADGWFRQGLARFSTGAQTEQAIEIKGHRRRGADDVLELWAPMRGVLVVGQDFVVTAGCDKAHATCRDRFSNAINFQGFPFIPGNDALVKVGRPSG
ncbi:MAG: DUF2163 domain-containing protein [Pseudomonadota bacterium]